MSTPLHEAASGGHWRVVRELLSHKAEVDPRDQTGWTPLASATIWGQVETMTALLDGGADPAARTEARVASAFCVLRSASWSWERGVLRALLYLCLFFRRVCYVLPQNGAVPLEIALHHERKGAASLLLARGALFLRVASAHSDGHTLCVTDLFFPQRTHA